MTKLESYNIVKTYVESCGYILLTTFDNYMGMGHGNKIEIRCPQGHYQMVTFEAFKKRKENGQFCLNKCFECYNLHRITLAKERAERLGYTLLTTQYTGVDNEIELICSEGHYWKTTYDRFMRVKAKCLTCNNKILAKNQKLSFEEVKNRINIEGYVLQSKEEEYNNNESLLTIKCPKGHIYKSSLGNFDNKGNRCPICNDNDTKGEKAIISFLEKYNIEFTKQKTFNDCKYINVLRFDFYLPKHNIIIEFDGRQHYEPVDYFGGEKAFKENQIRDNIKTQYCKDNNIKLIRIPYYEFKNVDTILNNILNLQ